MSKTLSFIFLIVALGTGYLATVAITNYVNANRANTPEQLAQEEQVAVAMANLNVPVGTTLTEEFVTSKNYPASLVPTNAFKVSEKDKYLGRVVRSPIYKDEPITSPRLQPEGAMAGLTGVIPDGLRAITLRVDDTSSVAGFLNPGNIVDVVCTLNNPSNSQSGPISKVILQNVKIIATGSELVPAEGKEQEAKKIPTVTVLTTLEQVERLSLASNSGQIRLVLRSHTDQNEQITMGATLGSLIPMADQDPSPPAPEFIIEEPEYEPEPVYEPEPEPRPVVRMHQVELYQGQSKQVLEFRK